MTNPQEALEWYSRKKEETYINMEDVFKNNNPGNDFVKRIIGTQNYCGVVRTTNAVLVQDIVKSLMNKERVDNIHIKYESSDIRYPKFFVSTWIITWEELAS